MKDYEKLYEDVIKENQGDLGSLHTAELIVRQACPELTGKNDESRQGRVADRIALGASVLVRTQFSLAPPPEAYLTQKTAY
jgi:hypothetical protein